VNNSRLFIRKLC